MPIHVEFDGTTHEFPDDFTQQDIAKALGGAKAPPSSALKDATSVAGELAPTVGGIAGTVAGGPAGAFLGGAAGEGYKQLLQHWSEIPDAVKDVLGNLLHGDESVRSATLEGGQRGALEGAGQAALSGGVQAALPAFVKYGVQPAAGALARSPVAVNVIRRGLGVLPTAIGGALGGTPGAIVGSGLREAMPGSAAVASGLRTIAGQGPAAVEGMAPAGLGVLQTTPGAALAAPSGAVLDDAALLAQKAARNVLRRQVGGFIGQASGGDPEMAAHLQQYSNALIEKSLTAGEQPNPATIWPAVKGEAAGYRASKAIDLPTAMMGSTPSPAGVGQAVQTLGRGQVKQQLQKLGEGPMWQAFKKMTPSGDD